MMRPPGEPDRVLDAAQVEQILNETFDAEAEAAQRSVAVLPQLQVPLQALQRPRLRHARLQQRGVVLTKRPADQLAEAGHQEVRRHQLKGNKHLCLCNIFIPNRTAYQNHGLQI